MATLIYKNCKLTEKRQLEIISLKGKYNSLKGKRKHNLMVKLFKEFNEEEKESFIFLPTSVNYFKGWHNND